MKVQKERELVRFIKLLRECKEIIKIKYLDKYEKSNRRAETCKNLANIKKTKTIFKMFGIYTSWMHSSGIYLPLTRSYKRPAVNTYPGLSC